MAFKPHDAATHALMRAEDLLDGARLGGIPGSVADDMRRSSIVLAIAAVDTYMHRLIADRADMWGSLPQKLAETEVRFDQLVEGAQASYDAARRLPFDSRPGVHVKNVLRNQLLLKSFQSLKKIDEALTMAGASGNWAAVGAQMGMTKKQISRRLSPIVLRRNQIAHEGDYERKDRPRDAKLHSISESDARSDIQFLRSLVDAIDAAI